jgi:hypothetical protein
VIHQIDDADRPLEALVRHVERIGQVIVDWIVELELATLGELHDRQPGEGLRDRANAEQRFVRIHGAARLHRIDAVALHQQRFAVADDRHLRAGDPLLRHEATDDAVDERFEVRQLGGRNALAYHGGERKKCRSGFSPTTTRSRAEARPTAAMHTR